MTSPIDDYIAEQDAAVREQLTELANIIRAEAPDATEKISWGMPTFHLNGNLVHFANGKHHVGFYPGSSGVENFLEELGDLKHSKGAIQFPKDQPLPADLVRRIVRFRLAEQLARKRR